MSPDVSGFREHSVMLARGVRVVKTTHKQIFVAAALAGVFPFTIAIAQETLDRTVLPIQEPPQPTYSELDARNAKAPPRFEVKAPQGAPNVVIVLIDDIGFGGPSTFGGPIRTPTLDQLAQGGLRFNNFHTTALCSPTRVALKSGRNHHTANAGSIMETATAFPGNTGQIPNSVAPLAEMLRLNGYSTGAFGKWHETAAWETSVSGPFDRWPTHQGFDKFYGFIGGETDQWYPLIYDGVIKVDPPKMKGYHFTVDMTNQAINWVKAQQSMTPEKPFFVYYATGAVQAPHHVPKEWADKYKGQFDKGWDQIRSESLERQKRLGVIPANTRLGDRPQDIPAWDSLPAETRRLFARQAEVFAGFLEHTDSEIGRFKKALEDIGALDVDQAGGFRLWRHPQRRGYSLAEAHQREGRDHGECGGRARASRDLAFTLIEQARYVQVDGAMRRATGTAGGLHPLQMLCAMQSRASDGRHERYGVAVDNEFFTRRP